MARRESQKPETVNAATTSGRSIFSDDRVRSRAYEIYDVRRRSGIYGDAMADWIAAERELEAHHDVDQESAMIGDNSTLLRFE